MTSSVPPVASTPRTPFWQLLIVWLLIPAVIAVLALARFESAYQNRIYPGVQALGIDLSGLSRPEAEQVLLTAAQTYDQPPLALRHGDQLWTLQMDELGVQVDVTAIANRAYAYGRNGDFLTNLAAQWRAFWQGEQQHLSMQAIPGEVTGAIASRTAHLNQPVTKPKITLSDLQVVVSASRPGQLVDVQATQQAVLERIAAGQGGVVDVVLHELAAVEADMSAGQEAIESLLDHPIVLADGRGDFQFALDPATLSTLVTWVPDAAATGGLSPEIQEEKVAALVATWAQQVSRPPLNARFDFNPNMKALVELSPSVDGYELDQPATIAAIYDAIMTGKASSELPVQIIPAAVRSEDAAKLGIKELVAEGTTRFAGSSEARVANIEVAASKLVGVVVPPGEVFSFNEHVGDVTSANGFEDSLIIAGDRTAVGVGGGVCQVSTTLFRAVWFGGFPLVERWNHGYVVSYYGAPGLDATVYTPTVDFKFRNTTDHYLLIKPVTNKQNGTLTFQFYGTKPGWQVKTVKPEINDTVKPPPPLYIEDPELPGDRVVQFDWAVDGLTATASRQVLAEDGTVLLKDTLNSRYLPWQAKFRFGPGFEPPAGAEVRRVSQSSE